MYVCVRLCVCACINDRTENYAKMKLKIFFLFDKWSDKVPSKIRFTVTKVNLWLHIQRVGQPEIFIVYVFNVADVDYVHLREKRINNIQMVRLC